MTRNSSRRPETCSHAACTSSTFSQTICTGACEQVSGRRELFRVMGCSRWREADGRRTCTIYAAAPRSEADTQRFATLGHELMHCTDGSWHDKWGRMHDEKVREARRSREGSAAAGGSAAGLPLDR
jgi:hypothetical protein